MYTQKARSKKLDFKHNLQSAALQKKDAGLESSKQIANNSNDPVQLKTKIKHTSADFTYNGSGHKDKVGTKMEAWLDPHNPIVGSSTGSPQKDLYQGVKSVAAASMVRGHLLNHDLGGFGVAENLYPITSSANSKHKFYAENPVQKELNDAHGAKSKDDRNDNSDGHGVYYSVTVGNLKTNVNDLTSNTVRFDCVANKLTDIGTTTTGNLGDLMFQTSILSNTNGAKSSDRGAAYKTGTTEDPDMKENTKVISPGWSHGGRSGTKNFAELIGMDKPIELAQHDGNTSSKDVTSKTDAVASSIGDVNETIKECNKAIDDANVAVGNYLYFMKEEQEAIERSALVRDAGYAVRLVVTEISRFNRTDFVEEDDIIESAEFILDLAQNALEKANMIQMKYW